MMVVVRPFLRRLNVLKQRNWLLQTLLVHNIPLPVHLYIAHHFPSQPPALCSAMMSDNQPRVLVNTSLILVVVMKHRTHNTPPNQRRTHSTPPNQHQTHNTPPNQHRTHNTAPIEMKAPMQYLLRLPALIYVRQQPLIFVKSRRFWAMMVG